MKGLVSLILSTWCQGSPPVALLSGSRLCFYEGEGHRLQGQPWRHREGFERLGKERIHRAWHWKQGEKDFQVIFWCGGWVIGRRVEGEKQKPWTWRNNWFGGNSQVQLLSFWVWGHSGKCHQKVTPFLVTWRLKNIHKQKNSKSCRSLKSSPQNILTTLSQPCPSLPWALWATSCSPNNFLPSPYPYVWF